MGHLPGEPISAVGGHVFALIFRTLKKVRPDRPIHPDGVALVGTLERYGHDLASGISWVDSPGTDHVTARLSRSLGLPDALPDILGLAVRIPKGEGHADVLLASTGASRAGRFILTLHRSPTAAVFTTLMPYKGEAGPVLLAARTLQAPALPLAAPGPFRRALGENLWALGFYYSRPGGTWTQFATLTLGIAPGLADTATRYDPVLNPLSGSGTYRWARRLREPSYTAARRPPKTPSSPAK